RVGGRGRQFERAGGPWGDTRTVTVVDDDIGGGGLVGDGDARGVDRAAGVVGDLEAERRTAHADDAALLHGTGDGNHRLTRHREGDGRSVGVVTRDRDGRRPFLRRACKGDRARRGRR